MKKILLDTNGYSRLAACWCLSTRPDAPRLKPTAFALNAHGEPGIRH